MYSRFLVAGVLTFAVAIPSASQRPNPDSRAFPLWAFDEQNDSCRSKGRLQDAAYCQSKLMQQITARPKEAVPILIAQLTGTRESREPIFDFWSKTTEGDIAYSILRDLFTEPDGRTFNLPGIQLPDQNCQSGAETCWRAFVRKHGRKSIQSQWRAAWNANRDRIYWSESAHCFRIK